jgi:putative spermidine/putrescine transport system permease protein
VLADTLVLSAQVTVVTALAAVPLAIAYRTAGPRLRTALLLAVLLPMLTSTVVRTFAWLVILGREGIVNGMLVGWGLLDEPARLLYTRGALVLALAQIMLPLQALPLMNAMLRVDDQMLQASEALGASRWRTCWRVLLPLAMPGLVAGALLSFTGASTAFVTQTLVGGGRQLFMPQYIHQQAIGLNNYGFAAAVAVVFVVAMLLAVVAASRAPVRLPGRA